MTCENYNCPCCLASGECIATYPEKCKQKKYEENMIQLLIDFISFVNRNNITNYIKRRLINEEKN